MIFSKIKEHYILVLTILIMILFSIIIYFNLYYFSNNFNNLGKYIALLGMAGTFINYVKTNGKGIFIGICLSLLIGGFIGIVADPWNNNWAHAEDFKEKVEIIK